MQAVKGLKKFQSTRPRGARLIFPMVNVILLLCFNPRAREGRDRPDRPGAYHRRGFNPRAREGRDKFFFTPYL